MRVLVAASLLLAGLSLLRPSALGYDPWAWLTWGREVAHLDLDTTGAASWKPLPVLFTTVFSLFGDAAPSLWLLLARASWLLAMALTYRLATRLAGRAAGIVAVLTLMLAPSADSRWLRLLALGTAEPLLVALSLWAVERHLDGRRDHAFVLGFLAALVRPEVWPFLGLYAVFLWRREPSKRLMVAALLAAVPLAWFGGDWWGSGDPLTGPDRARVIENTDIDRGARILSRTFGMVIVPVWLAAVAGAAFAARRRERTTLVLAAGALAWIGIVAVMITALGFAASPRFMIPAAAIVSVLAGVGAVRLVRAAGGTRARLVAGVLAFVAALPFALPRVQALGRQVSIAATYTNVQRDLRTLVDRAGGRSGLLACGRLAVDQAHVAIRGQAVLAWELDVHVASVRPRLGPNPGIVITRLHGARNERLSRAQPRVAHLIRSGDWEAFAVRCPSVRPVSSPRAIKSPPR